VLRAASYRTERGRPALHARSPQYRVRQVDERTLDADLVRDASGERLHAGRLGRVVTGRDGVIAASFAKCFAGSAASPVTKQS
jgi:hypothetical protein